MGPVPLLEVRDLAVTFAGDDGPLRAVDGASFALAAGEVVGLVGESGCGKSVTALALLGLVRAPGRVTGGQVLYDGADLAAMDEDALRSIRGNRVSMIFQEPMTALNPVFTVGDQVAEVLTQHRGMERGEAWRAAVVMLARVGIAEAEARASAYPHQLSGGMRQRAMIAMALACGPDVLIADEPTTALDVTIQAQILDLLLAAQRHSGMAVLFISHNLAVVSEIADRVLVMYAGRIVEDGPAQVVLSSPLHPYTRGLIETLPANAVRGRRLPAIPGAVPDPRALPQGCRFSDRCPLADAGCHRSEPPLVTLGSRRVACFKAAP